VLPTEIPRLKPRREHVAAQRVDLAEIAPELLPYLGHAAYIELDAFERLSRIVAAAEDLAAKETVSAAAGFALAKHQGLIAEIRRRDGDPAEVMRPFARAIDGFGDLTAGADWQEDLLGVYVTQGFLVDFFIRLAGGLSDAGPRAAQLLGTASGEEAIVELLRREIEADPTLGSRLAMWGRRLLGDTMLVARSALHHSGNAQSDEERSEPVFTEVIAAHTRRMDALGLTA
jgi:hypothetical protein